MILLALVAAAVVEVGTFVAVAGATGWGWALVAVIAVSASGPLLVRRAGSGVVARARGRIAAGETPDEEVLDGVVLLLAGVLVCVPGFVGDAVGLLLLLGPVRRATIRLAGRHVAHRMVGTGRVGRTRRGPTVGSGSRREAGSVVDATTHDDPD